MPDALLAAQPAPPLLPPLPTPAAAAGMPEALLAPPPPFAAARGVEAAEERTPYRGMGHGRFAAASSAHCAAALPRGLPAAHLGDPGAAPPALTRPYLTTKPWEPLMLGTATPLRLASTREASATLPMVTLA